MLTTPIILLAIDDGRQFVLASIRGYPVVELNGDLILRVVIRVACGSSKSDLSCAIDIDLLIVGSRHDENEFLAAIVWQG